MGSRPGPDFLVHVDVLARLFRSKMLAILTQAHAQGRLLFLDHLAGLARRRVFKRFLGPVRHGEIDRLLQGTVAQGKEAVLRYLARYTHHVAISNQRLLAADNRGVSFRWKDYRIDRPRPLKTMTLAAHEFIRRFLLHVLPKGFHRIRRYGLLANGNRAAAIARGARVAQVPTASARTRADRRGTFDEPRTLPSPCPCCGGRMHVIETLRRGRRHTEPAPAPITPAGCSIVGLAAPRTTLRTRIRPLLPTSPLRRQCSIPVGSARGTRARCTT